MVISKESSPSWLQTPWKMPPRMAKPFARCKKKVYLRQESMWCDDTTDVPLDNDPPAARHHMLYATGPQDDVLTNNPEYTFWKTEHAQYHSFGQEIKEYLFKDSLPDGTLKQAFGRVHTTKIPVDDADLLGPLVLQVSLPPLLQSKWFGNRRTNWIRWSYGGVLALVKKVELVANGTILQEFNSRILDMEANMVVSKDHQRGYNRMTGRNESNLALEPTFYYLPLPFWFCRTTGTSRQYCSQHGGRPSSTTPTPWRSVRATLPRKPSA